MIQPGDIPPAFRLQADDGEWLTLGEGALATGAGRRVLLYFYQKDDSPGCTAEACGFRDIFPRFQEDHVTVVGISPDSVRRHQRFRAKHALPFILLSDPDHAVCEAYGTWQRKLFWGRYYMGVVRTSVLIGTDGRVEHAWHDVDHRIHAAEVSAWLRGEPMPEAAATKAAARKAPSKATSKVAAKKKAPSGKAPTRKAAKKK